MKLAIILGITLAAFVAGTFADCHGGGCDENFKGFGTEPGKCGCCPWPCCCKCVEVAGGGDCTATTGEPECPCVDLTFMVDASGSVSPFVWTITMQFIADVLNITMRIVDEAGCQDIINMAMITFGDNATLHWGPLPGAEVINNITSVPQAKRFTNMVEAMELAINSVYSSNSNCIPYAVFITDGRANFRIAEIKSMGEAMRIAVKGNLMCIGITTAISAEELNLICPDGYITLSDQSGLVEELVKDIAADIAASIPPPVPQNCPGEEECFCCCSPEQYWGGARGRY